jgi:hypothetical protein
VLLAIATLQQPRRAAAATTAAAAAGNVALLSLKSGHLLLVALKFEGSAASKMQVRLHGRLLE